MSLKIILYRLQPDKNGNTVLDYSLNSDEILISNDLEKVEVKLEGKIFTIQKAFYMNKKIYDFGRGFLYMANKQVRPEYVFDLLMEYAIRKLDTRAMHLACAREKFVKELNQHRKLIAA